MSDHEDMGSRASGLVRAYFEALLAAEAPAAEAAVREAMDARLSYAAIEAHVIAPALALVRESWRLGEIPPAAECAALKISMRVRALQREAQRVACARATHTVLLATPAGDLHLVALRFVGDLLRDAGYDVVMLGADVSPDALVISAQRYRAAAICMSATMPSRVDHLRDAIDAVQLLCAHVGFVLGGHGLSAELAAWPNVRICEHVSEAVEAVDAIVTRAFLN